jgi:flagellar hook-length control protein FliK
MDAAAAPPPDLATVVAPQSRGPPGAVRPPGQRDPGGSAVLAPFDLLLQLLGSALPAGQGLPVGGSGLPASADATSAVAAPGACAVTAGQSATSTQGSPTTLADWLRLQLAQATRQPDASLPVDPTAPTSAPTSPSGALAAASAPTDAKPIDLQALLGANAEAQPQAQSLAALASAPRERVADGGSQRRAQASLTQSAGAAAPAATSDLKPIDPSALHVDLPVPVTVTQVPAALEKTVRLDDDALPLVTPTTGADSVSAPAVPLLHTSTSTHATAASAAATQSALPQSAGDALDTNAARWHDALAARIQWLVDHDVGEAKIKLNPPELGALDVKIALQDDKTYVQMVAHSASARDELAQSLPRLRELLSAGGLELGGATVSGGHDDRGAFGSAAPQPITRMAAFASAADDVRPDIPRARLGVGAAVIDTFA